MAHRGIKGNEIVDDLEKHAGQRGYSRNFIQ